MTWDDKPYENLVSNKPLLDLYKENSAHLGVSWQEKVLKDVKSSTDMGNVSRVVPSIHPVFSLQTETIIHSAKFTAVSGLYSCNVYTIATSYCLTFSVSELLCCNIMLVIVFLFLM